MKRRDLKHITEIDTFRMEDIVCPYCGYHHDFNYELLGNIQAADEDLLDLDCEDCGRYFIFQIHISINFTSFTEAEFAESNVGEER